MAPAVIAASAVQVNVLVNSGFAASLGNGPVSWLNIAFRLMQLPLGIFGVAIGTVTLPLVSNSAAVGNIDEFRGILASGMRLAFLLTIPSAIGLVMLASPIISVIYQHGRFTAEMTRQTAGALQFYAIGLVAYSALKVLTPAFYAIGKRNTPMLVSFLGDWNKSFSELALYFPAGMGTSRSRVLHQYRRDDQFSFALRADVAADARDWRVVGCLAGWPRFAWRGLLLALVCWAANYWWLDAWEHLRFFEKLFALFGTILVSAAVFFGAALLLRG